MNEKLKLIKEYIMTYLKDPLTWRGILYVGAALGVVVRPECANIFVAVGLFMAGLIAILSNENSR